MKRAQTRQSYAKRIERVTVYIAEHLDDTLALETLADIAHFSPFHFHRVYHAMVGETLADTVRRLRMHRAANDLIRSDLAIVRIARRAGYGSSEAFTRAFAADYGEPPGAYRARRSERSPNRVMPVEETFMYDVSIKTTKPMRLAAIDHRGEYNGIGKAFERLFAWGAARGLVGPGTRSIGVYYDDPESVPAKDLRAVAGFEVGADFKGEGDVRVVEVAGGPVASVVHKGPYAELHEAYRFSTTIGCRPAAASLRMRRASKSISTIRAACRRRSG